MNSLKIRNPTRSIAQSSPKLYYRQQNQQRRGSGFRVHAGPNLGGGGGGGGDGGGSNDNGQTVLNLALPLTGVVALVFIAGPLFGTAVFGLPFLVVAIAAVTGILDRFAAALGTNTLAAAGIVAGSTLGLFLIPAFLKFALVIGAGAFITNLVFGRGGILNAEEEEYIEARDAIIDVEAETVDD